MVYIPYISFIHSSFSHSFTHSGHLHWFHVTATVNTAMLGWESTDVFLAYWPRFFWIYAQEWASQMYDSSTFNFIESSHCSFWEPDCLPPHQLCTVHPCLSCTQLWSQPLLSRLLLLWNVPLHVCGTEVFSTGWLCGSTPALCELSVRTRCDLISPKSPLSKR